MNLWEYFWIVIISFSIVSYSGIDLATVSKLVGHKQITTTQIHYNQLSISKQTDELKKFKLISKPQKD